MKARNRIITISITGFATASLSSLLISLFIFGGISGELIMPMLIISLPAVYLLGTPVALLINHYIKGERLSTYLIKLVLHLIAGIITTFIFLVIIGEFRAAVGNQSALFYISGSINSVMYLIIFSLIKRTGDTDFE